MEHRIGQRRRAQMGPLDGAGPDRGGARSAAPHETRTESKGPRLRRLARLDLDAERDGGGQEPVLTYAPVVPRSTLPDGALHRGPSSAEVRAAARPPSGGAQPDPGREEPAPARPIICAGSRSAEMAARGSATRAAPTGEISHPGRLNRALRRHERDARPRGGQRGDAGDGRRTIAAPLPSRLQDGAPTRRIRHAGRCLAVAGAPFEANKHPQGSDFSDAGRPLCARQGQLPDAGRPDAEAATLSRAIMRARPGHPIRRQVSDARQSQVPLAAGPAAKEPARRRAGTTSRPGEDAGPWVIVRLDRSRVACGPDAIVDARSSAVVHPRPGNPIPCHGARAQQRRTRDAGGAGAVDWSPDRAVIATPRRIKCGPEVGRADARRTWSARARSALSWAPERAAFATPTGLQIPATTRSRVAAPRGQRGAQVGHSRSVRQDHSTGAGLPPIAACWLAPEPGHEQNAARGGGLPAGAREGHDALAPAAPCFDAVTPAPASGRSEAASTGGGPHQAARKRRKAGAAPAESAPSCLRPIGPEDFRAGRSANPVARSSAVWGPRTGDHRGRGQAAPTRRPHRAPTPGGHCRCAHQGQKPGAARRTDSGRKSSAFVGPLAPRRAAVPPLADRPSGPTLRRGTANHPGHNHAAHRADSDAPGAAGRRADALWGHVTSAGRSHSHPSPGRVRPLGPILHRDGRRTDGPASSRTDGTASGAPLPPKKIRPVGAKSSRGARRAQSGAPRGAAFVPRDAQRSTPSLRRPCGPHLDRVEPGAPKTARAAAPSEARAPGGNPSPTPRRPFGPETSRDGGGGRDVHAAGRLQPAAPENAAESPTPARPSLHRGRGPADSRSRARALNASQARPHSNAAGDQPPLSGPYICRGRGPAEPEPRPGAGSLSQARTKMSSPFVCRPSGPANGRDDRRRANVVSRFGASIITPAATSFAARKKAPRLGPLFCRGERPADHQARASARVSSPAAQDALPFELRPVGPKGARSARRTARGKARAGAEIKAPSAASDACPKPRRPMGPEYHRHARRSAMSGSRPGVEMGTPTAASDACASGSARPAPQEHRAGRRRAILRSRCSAESSAPAATRSAATSPTRRQSPVEARGGRPARIDPRASADRCAPAAPIPTDANCPTRRPAPMTDRAGPGRRGPQRPRSQEPMPGRPRPITTTAAGAAR